MSLDKKETSKNYYRQWYENNKERLSTKLNEKKERPCGGRYTVVNEKTHFKSQRHKDYMDKQNIPPLAFASKSEDFLENIEVKDKPDLKDVIFNKITIEEVVELPKEDDELIPFFMDIINKKKPEEYSDNKRKEISDIVELLNEISTIHDDVIEKIKLFLT